MKNDNQTPLNPEDEGEQLILWPELGPVEDNKDSNVDQS